MLISSKSKMMKILISMVILINIFSIKALAIVKPTSDFYVNDYANLLDTDTENYIIHMNQELYDKTGAQIVVVTVPNLGEDSLEEYATKLFRSFGIGDKTKNNGVLLLLALEERQFRVEVGYGLEGRLNDAKTGRIQDKYIIPYLKNNYWKDGIRNGFNAVLQEVLEEYNISIENVETVNREVDNTNLITRIIKDICLIFTISFMLGFTTKNFSRKHDTIYVVFLVGMIILLLKLIWTSGNTYLVFSIGSSIAGFILGMFSKSGRFFLWRRKFFRWKFFRRRFFRWRWFLRWWRKFKKFLKKDERKYGK